MIAEDYVSFETAKLLKEKGFDENTPINYFVGDDKPRGCAVGEMIYHKRAEGDAHLIACPTLWVAMKWLRELHNVLIISDYDYECTDNPYCYKIYKLGENGKPKQVPIEGISYNMFNEPHLEIVAYRDYEKSFFNYKTYEEACEAAIKDCLENLI